MTLLVMPGGMQNALHVLDQQQGGGWARACPAVLAEIAAAVSEVEQVTASAGGGNADDMADAVTCSMDT